MTFDLTKYDRIVVNSSAGKDSQASLSVVVSLARSQGVIERVEVLHVDMGSMEWAGTGELATAQADHFGVPITITRKRTKSADDLLDRVVERGMFPGPSGRWCTSDFKRGPARKHFTALAKAADIERPYRILSVTGIRAEESPDRAKKAALESGQVDTKNQIVDEWRPILAWTEAEVWAEIDLSGAPHHIAYDLGMSRLSCAACVYAKKSDLVIAARHNRALFARIAEVEDITGHTFKHNWSIREAIAEAETPVLLTST